MRLDDSFAFVQFRIERLPDFAELVDPAVIHQDVNKIPDGIAQFQALSNLFKHSLLRFALDRRARQKTAKLGRLGVRIHK